MITDLFLSVFEISLSTSLLILVLILLAPLLNRRYAAKWNYLIWIFLALRLLIPFHGPSPADMLTKFTVPSTAQSNGIPTATHPSEAVTEQRIVVEIPSQFTAPIVVPSEKGNTGITLLNAAAVIWLTTAAAFISFHIFSYLHYRRQLLKNGTRIKDTPSLQLLLSLSKELKIKQTIALIQYSKAGSPMIMGFLKPVLVLPKEYYSEEELYFILKHELIHLKRKDVYAKLLFVAANAMHWFNPLIWLMQKEAVIDMELSCDERVIRGAEYTVRKAYTETLFSMLHRKRAKKTTLSTQFYGGKQVMKKRFKNILEKAKKKNGVFFLISAIALTIGCGTLIGCSVNSAAIGQEHSHKEILPCLVKIDGMEYAVRNPKSYPESAVFLRRAEGDDIWEEVELKTEESDGIRRLENPMLAFSSKEEGMIAFHEDVTVVLTTKDGGTTWEEKKNIPEVGKSEHQMLLCLAAAGQGRFVMGYRYWGTDGQEGNVFLTKDNAETWQQVQMPIPKPAGMTLAYIEPVAFRQEGKSLFLEICYRGDDADGKRMEAHYEAVSTDGGETWELAGKEELNFVPFE